MVQRIRRHRPQPVVSTIPSQLPLLLALALLFGIFDGVAASRSFHLRQPASSSLPVDEFPALEDVREMAGLSHEVYKFKHRKDVDKVCDDWNNQADGVTCHWYRHDLTLGTQVMIVSSSEKDYLAVVFAGTDDVMTALLDVDVKKVDFGTRQFDQENKANASKIPVSLDCDECKVHEGFNNAVFCSHVFDDIYVRVEALRRQFTRLFTTGHSLGAANAVLTAIGLALEFEEKQFTLPHPVTSINFGCPQVGNNEFQEYIHSHFMTHPNTTRSNPYLSIWRFVLGWDLVPRLPEFFYHVGHTAQMIHQECREIITDCYFDDDDKSSWVWPGHHDNMTKEALTYYHHYGNGTLHYAGVPPHWGAKPYMWVPGALMSHEMVKYAEYLREWSPQTWIHDFVSADEDPPSNSSDALIDDDAYAEPPDDDAAYMVLEQQEESGIWQRVERRLRKWMWR